MTAARTMKKEYLPGGSKRQHILNKAEQYERQKIKFLEDRIKVLEKSIEAIHKVLGIAASKAMENNHE